MNTISSWKNSSRIWFDIKTQLEKCNGNIVIYDLETTGLSRVKDRIIEMAAIRFHIDDKGDMTEEDTLHRFINPQMPLPPDITDLTGITESQIVSAPTEADIFDDVYDFFCDYVVGGYNIEAFDNKFMDAYYGRMGARFQPTGSVDGIKMAKDRLVKGKDVENHKLSTIADYLGISFNAHSAIEDARATSEVIRLLLKEYIYSEKMGEDLAPCGVIRPEIKEISFWEGYRGFSRIYITTSVGNIFYDIRSKVWGGKAPLDISTVDMEWVEKEAWRITNSSDETEFAKFKGEIAA